MYVAPPQLLIWLSLPAGPGSPGQKEGIQLQLQKEDSAHQHTTSYRAFSSVVVTPFGPTNSPNHRSRRTGLRGGKPMMGLSS
uniref:Putative secreted protein n=1 Tax=Anopheles triannulatus TaxID=58253 RepID=A0A2M4B7L0_9DIPT